jgi:magnesium-transporting ATPase (P-type)
MSKTGEPDPFPRYSFHILESKECFEKLELGSKFDTKEGLSKAEAASRLEKYGLNQLSGKKKSTIFEKIWRQVANVLVLILVVVAVVSAIRAITATTTDDIISNWIQVGLITFVITLNTYIGILQEGKAEKAAEALKSMLSSDAMVIREGQEQKIPSNEVVPGDLVILGLGDRVPADLRCLQVANLACQEAALTGESLPVEKQIAPLSCEKPEDAERIPLGDRINLCFSATLVTQGRGMGVVIYTGDRTEIGTINALVNKVERKKTNVLEQIDHISKWLAFFIVLTAIVTMLVAIFKTGLNPLDALTVALTCAVAMIPEGLEAIVTLTYAWAVSNMAKHNAIIRALPAVETLGSVTVICSDKTGTLTKNEMSLVAFVTATERYKFDTDATSKDTTSVVRDDTYMITRAGEDEEDEMAQPSVEKKGEHPTKEYLHGLLSCGILCTKSVLTEDDAIGNPTELAVLKGAYKAGIDINGFKKELPCIAEVPFSSEYKFMATVHDMKQPIGSKTPGDNIVVYAKGAPDKMVHMCKYETDDETPIKPDYWQEQISILSSYGLRVIALCRGIIPKSEVEQDANLGPEFINGRGPWLTMIGLCAIMDPPRPECVQAISDAHGAGVRVAMITGDHKDTAQAIGRMLGIVSPKYPGAVTGVELDEMTEEQLRLAVMTNNVFARATPENKIQIVKALQSEGQICSMTGDGVNDAPALKAANMGVAMGLEGTDVAREASEMILADDNFATIVYAVREGRTVWDNLRKVLLVNTPINNAQGLSVLFGMVCGLEKPILTPIQVLYCNLICAVTLGFVCAIEPAEKGIMDIPPRRVGKRLVGRYLFLRIALGTVTLVTCTVAAVFIANSIKDYPLGMQRSLASNTLTCSACSITLSARFAYNSAVHPRVFMGNKAAIYSVLITVGLQLFITYVPGVNTVIFSMDGQDGLQWIIVIVCVFITFFVMEGEKALRRYLKAHGADTDDSLRDELFDADVRNPSYHLPKGVSHLKLAPLKK